MMNRWFNRSTQVLTLAIAGLLCTENFAAAWPRTGLGNSYGGGYGMYGGYTGSGYYGTGGVYGYSPYYTGYGYSPYYAGWGQPASYTMFGTYPYYGSPGYDIASPINPYAYGSPYGSASGYGPYYAAAPYGSAGLLPASMSASGTSPIVQAGYSSTTSGASTLPDMTARVRINIADPNADVMIDGMKTSSTGTVREYRSPSLTDGNYTYEIRANWTENGQSKTKTEKIRVTPGSFTTVNFPDTTK